MSINEVLLREIEPFFDKYSLWPHELRPFMRDRAELLVRQRQAIHIIDGVMTRHGKKQLLNHVAELARIEHGITELEPRIRDHVVHALLSFILGIYLNERFLKASSTVIVDGFQWKLAGLFHDIGYPAQIATRMLDSTVSHVRRIKNSLQPGRPDAGFQVRPVGFNTLNQDIDAFDLIQRCLDGWELQIDAKLEYENILIEGKICHGMMSSLILLYVIDILYQRYNPQRLHEDIYCEGDSNWNQMYFEQDVVAACSAIFVHNLPSRCFTDAKIVREKAPVAYLLKLSDALQEWERPSGEDEWGSSAELFDISVDRGPRLTFYANLPRLKVERMADEISSYLAGADIELFTDLVTGSV